MVQSHFETEFGCKQPQIIIILEIICNSLGLGNKQSYTLGKLINCNKWIIMSS